MGICAPRRACGGAQNPTDTTDTKYTKNTEIYNKLIQNKK